MKINIIMLKTFCLSIFMAIIGVCFSVCVAAEFESCVSAFEHGEFISAKKIIFKLCKEKNKKNKNDPLVVQSYVLAMSDVIERSDVNSDLLRHIEENQNHAGVSENDNPFYQTLLGRLHLSGVLGNSNPKKGLELIQKHAHGYAAYLLGQY